MAFVYCEMCDWQQDDFWSWRYNPIRCWFSRVRDYGKPRMIHFDPVKSGSYGYCHSWRVLLCETANLIRRVANMHWPTHKVWKRACTEGKWPNCPRCGRNSLDVD